METTAPGSALFATSSSTTAPPEPMITDSSALPDLPWPPAWMIVLAFSVTALGAALAVLVYLLNFPPDQPGASLAFAEWEKKTPLGRRVRRRWRRRELESGSGSGSGSGFGADEDEDDDGFTDTDCDEGEGGAFLDPPPSSSRSTAFSSPPLLRQDGFPTPRFGANTSSAGPATTGFPATLPLCPRAEMGWTGRCATRDPGSSYRLGSGSGSDSDSDVDALGDGLARPRRWIRDRGGDGSLGGYVRLAGGGRQRRHDIKGFLERVEGVVDGGVEMVVRLVEDDGGEEGLFCPIKAEERGETCYGWE